MFYRNLLRPLLFKLDAERAHHLIIHALRDIGKFKWGVASIRAIYGVKETPDLTVRAWGCHFANPIGLAAGLDKNADCIAGLSAMGFGFIEVGTITPLGQLGNERPRLYRLPSDEAIINRMGFNNVGAQKIALQLSLLNERSIPLGINIGKNKHTSQSIAYRDYVNCVQWLYPYADYFIVNISSPNTPDLRNLQHGSELETLLSATMEEMDRQKEAVNGPQKGLFVKIAPDLTCHELEGIIDTLCRLGVSGVVATNTTLSRNHLTHRHAQQSGGLSGKPLRDRSTEMIQSIYKQSQGKLFIIGSGGVFSGKDAYEKIKAGASLVQIYSSFIYEGPSVNRSINASLRKLLHEDGFTHISEAVGTG